MQVQLYLESFRELIHVVLNLRPRVVISKEHAPRAQRLPEDAHLKVGFISLVRGVQVDEINLDPEREQVSAADERRSDHGHDVRGADLAFLDRALDVEHELPIAGGAPVHQLAGCQLLLPVIAV